MAEPPVWLGALHDKSICVCPFAVAVNPVGAPGAVLVVVPTAVADQGPSPAALTARTCTSYWVPPMSPVATYCREPEPVQASRVTVQLASILLGASLRMWRKS